MLVIKLRIFAIMMRLQELDQEVRDKRFRAQFLNDQVMISRLPQPVSVIQLYDKKGKPFNPPKSKYHK